MGTNQETFNTYVGETMMFCQCIEHDVKWLYAGMLNGDVNTNLKKVKLLGLGKAVDMLRFLDNSDGKPYLGTGDYKLLADIAKNIRNHWAHQGYVEYVYEKDNFDDAFSKQYKRLINDHNRLQKLYRQIEKIRIDFFNTNR